jgi:ketosteroid isomerase-like protein
MASTNLDLVRSIFSDWERGDFSSAAWADPEIEFVMADGPMAGSWKGLAGMAEAQREWLTAWEKLRQEPEEYRELDGERILALHRFSARGKGSGLEVGHIRTEAAALFHFRDGKVFKLVHYFDRRRALADLGLASEAASSSP